MIGPVGSRHEACRKYVEIWSCKTSCVIHNAADTDHSSIVAVLGFTGFTYSLHCSSFFWLTKISIIGS